MDKRQTAANKPETLSRKKKGKGVPAASPATPIGEANGSSDEGRKAAGASRKSPVKLREEAALPATSASSADLEGRGAEAGELASSSAAAAAQVEPAQVEAVAVPSSSPATAGRSAEPAQVEAVAVPSSSPATAGRSAEANGVNGQRAGPPPATHAPTRLPGTFAGIVATKVEWLVKPYLPRGLAILLVGGPDAGKSTFIAGICAMQTGGPALGGQRVLPAGRVLLTSPELDAGSMLQPRLLAAGADLGRVYGCEFDDRKQRLSRLRFPKDKDLLQRWVKELGLSGVFIDPITRHLADGVDPMNNRDVSEIMDGFNDIALTEGCLIIASHHPRKSGDGTLLQCVAGSAAWTEVPRIVLALGADPNRPKQRVLAMPKNSLVDDKPSRMYELANVDGYPAFRLGGSSSLLPDDLKLAVETPGKRDKRQLARTLFKELLAEGESDAKTVNARARELDISSEILSEIKVALGVWCGPVGPNSARKFVYRPPEEWPE